MPDFWIWYDNNYITITNNTFINNPCGIDIIGDNHHRIIDNNKFQNNKNGVVIRNDDHDSVHHFSITNNVFEINKNTGLSLHFTTDSIISQNTFINNNLEVTLYKAKGNKITKNNFIGNTKHATFRYYEKREKCYWRNNYWDNWFKFFPIPRPIKSVVRYYNMWGEPYDTRWYKID